MSVSKGLVIVFSVLWFAMTVGCGGGGGSDSGSSSTGTLSMSMTDAKPLLPVGVTNCFVTIDEVLVHKSGGEWESLPMVQNPYTIDLLQFTDGATTEFVPPVPLDSGRYTQVRLSVVSAKLRFNDDPNDEVEITIPSENLKTDKNFDFDVAESAAVDITVDFDLSKAIVVTGAPGSPSYQLKPVLHIVETAEAATIEGFVANSGFPAGDYVVISVLDSTGQEYTRLQVDRDSTAGATDTAYSIFWLVPNQAYTVQINYNPGLDDDPVEDGIQDNYDETVDVPPASDPDYPDGTLPFGDVYPLDFPPTT
jgi:Domain of unknown function (DUF4382)